MKALALIFEPSFRLVDYFCRNQIFSRFELIKEGCIEIEETFKGGSVYTFGESGNSLLRSKMKIHDPIAYSKMALGGSIATGESFSVGEWSCNSLTDLIRVFARNRDVVMKVDLGIARLGNLFQKIFHRFHQNSIPGARKNIKAHYDLGNDFFELFLDSNWMYSSAVFLKNESTLEEAQFEKVDRICRSLNLKPSDHLLEIGTGWGGFALHAAKYYGCKVTTTTISEKQFELATKRVRDSGLQDQITVLKKDYRLLEGQFDKLVSIEMIEAVGLDYLGIYFEKCSSLLKPEGEMVIQAITIRDDFYEHAKNNVDFIQRYIFPGSGIPCLEVMSRLVKEKTDLQITQLEDFGYHYARTLSVWSERLKSNHHELTRRGYSEELYRMFQFYFSYCEGGFLEKTISVLQMKFSKPKWNRDSTVGREQ
jgi:cyclopropane-fatty-acyl-phospholipid synthase